MTSSRSSNWKFLVWSLNVPYGAESLHNELLVILWAVARPNQTTSSTPDLHQVFNLRTTWPLLVVMKTFCQPCPSQRRILNPTCPLEKNISATKICNSIHIYDVSYIMYWEHAYYYTVFTRNHFLIALWMEGLIGLFINDVALGLKDKSFGAWVLIRPLEKNNKNAWIF
jgi:hypothetical protein